jgi:Peptidase family S58
VQWAPGPALCLRIQGGIGTSAWRLPAPLVGYTAGVLVETNFTELLSVAGVPVAKELRDHYLKHYLDEKQWCHQPNASTDWGWLDHSCGGDLCVATSGPLG